MKRINDEEFDQKVLDGKTVVVKFTASWCSPCRALTPLLEAASSDHPHISFYEVDIEENSELTEDYEVRSLPTTIFFHNGSEIGRAVGLIKRAVLYAVLSKWSE